MSQKTYMIIAVAAFVIFMVIGTAATLTHIGGTVAN